jgi:hypothetical protein
MTTCPVSGLKIMVRNNVITMVCTGSAGGPLGLVLLFMWMALDHESLKVNRRATTKAACSVAVPMLP